VRIAQHIGFQSSEKVAVAFHFWVDQNTGPSWIRDDLFRKRETPFRVVPGYSIALRRSNSFDLVSEVSLFLQKQTVSIGKKKLQIA
jgi:hypothetical protein